MRTEESFWFGQINLAPVAMFRLVFGLLTVNWFWQLFPNLTAFFTDEGIFPRSSQVSFFPLNFTLLNIAGDWWQVALLWLFSIGAALCLAIGFRTRTAAIATFVMLGSFSMRDPLIGDSSDQVFRATAFWLMFTAAGDRYSVDAWLRARHGNPSTGRGWALPVRILELQFAWIYLATGLDKLTGTLWRDGLAVFYSLQLDHTYARTWATPLARNLDLSRLATYLTLVAELSFMPLAFIPAVRRIGRITAIVAAAGLQLAILLFMNVGNFPIVMLAGLIPFMPARWIERIAMLMRIPDARIPQEQAASVQLNVAASRKRVVAAFGLCVLAAIVFLSALPAYAARPRPLPIDHALRYANLLQTWNMFSPDPTTVEGWLHIPALLSDGSRLDLATGGVPDDEPLYADPMYSRWLKATESIAYSDSSYRLEYARMYCRTRNFDLRVGEAAIVSFDIVYTERVVAPPGEDPPPLRQVVLWSHRC